jgi:serine acetyltransferase
MAEPQRKPEQQNVREFLDPMTSDRKGFAGFVESLLRKFKNFVHIALIVPLSASIVVMLGVAAAPGIAAYRGIMAITQGSPFWLECFYIGASAAIAFFLFGITLLFVAPVLNLCFGGKLKPWRGPYYSLEAIRWYLHNAVLYMVRYSFLEFVTPTPLSILFYKMMGMKIGKGSAINTTWISDPSLIEIGKKVTIGGSAALLGHYGQGGYLVLAPVKIGDGATIGLKATLMGGVTIGENAKILPHSVVLPKTVVPAGETWGGVPARKI